MKNRFLVLIVLLAFVIYFIACEFKKADHVCFKIKRNEFGNLESEISYLNDSILDGIAKYYYQKPANILMDEIEYHNGIQNGWHNHYNEFGKLIERVHYSNDLPDGKDFRYYADGLTLESETQWRKGKRFGIGKWFYKNGILRTINITDLFEKVIWVVKYNEKGIKTNEEGVVISPNIIFTYTDDSLARPIDENQIKLKKEIKISFSVTELPEYKTSLIIEDKDNHKKFDLKIEEFTAFYKKIIVKREEFRFTIFGEIKDANGKIFKQDTLNVNLKACE